MVRAFLAIEVPPEYRPGLAAVQESLKRSGADVRWVAPANIHLTLKFLGDITAAQVAQVAEGAAAAAAATPVFTLQASGVGMFPSSKNPRVIWLGLDGQLETLGILVQHLEDALEALGFPKENRAFTPHLTLGRVRSSRGKEALQKQVQSLQLPPFPPFQVARVVLYQSTLRPSGAVYTILQQSPLAERIG